jgi:hypothetical protein
MYFDPTHETRGFSKKCCDFNFGFAIKMKVQEQEWIERVFQDSNTMLSQV